MKTPMHLAVKISMPLGVVAVQTGSTTAKMAKSAVSGDRLG